MSPEKKVKSVSPTDSPADSPGSAKPKGPDFAPKQLATIRESLLERRSGLLQQQENQLSALNSPEKHHIADLEEMGADGADTDQLCALVDLNSSNIDQIDLALKKLDAGNYGVCESCMEPIPAARLEFLPFAALCVECQQKKELNTQVTDALET